MRRLAIDIGNSRLKWGEFAGRRLQHSGALAMPVSGWDWLDGMQPPEAVAVSCVAGDEIGKALRRQLELRWSVPVQEIASVAAAAGVQNGYSVPSALGIDRWCALVAAHARVPDQPVVVVDVGSACTVDAMDASGVHYGGYIVPGGRQMVTALRRGTAEVEFTEVAAGAAPAWGRDTAGAVAQGIRESLAGIIDRSVRRFAVQMGGPVACLLTGGDGESVLSRVEADCRYLPHLVLEGVALLAEAECGKR